MEENLDAIEKHYEKIEAEKIMALQESRKNEIAKYQVEGAFIPDNLGTLTEEVYNNYLLGVKTAHDQKIKAEQDAKEAEEKKLRVENLHQDRKNEILNDWNFVPEENKNDNFGLYTQTSWLAFSAFLLEEKQKYEANQEKVRKENEQLKKEAEEKEAALKAEREKAGAALRKEREEKERMQRELDDKAAAEKAAAEKAEADRQAEFSKGDSEKVKDLIVYLETAKTKFSFKSKKNVKMYSDVCVLIDKIINHIEK
jgi:hypothetical protein